jgi:hypothetical protein
MARDSVMKELLDQEELKKKKNIRETLLLKMKTTYLYTHVS